MVTPVIVWFRRDLRLRDNPALRAAIATGQPVIPVFIWSPDEEGNWAPGSASRYWLRQSLQHLDAALRKLNARLVLRRGSGHGGSRGVIHDLLEEAGADTVYWNRLYEPAAIARDATIKQTLRDNGYTVESFNANLLFEPPQTANKQGKPFRVFTPFWKHCRARGEPEQPLPAVRKLTGPGRWPKSDSLAALQLEPAIDWADGIRAAWRFGEHGAQQTLRDFLADALPDYPKQRDFPGHDGVSTLSPYLHFGEISPRQVWHAVREHEAAQGRMSESKAAEAFLRQLGWREFGHHLLYHFPHTSTKPLNEAYEAFPWLKNRKALRAWQRGMTGYPIVDAGMRQLWHTGYMHNRTRMVVASFLVKDLLIHWLEGARWFWDTLVDADLANNALGWQWTAGCGADAAPYFRIFNPVRQGERFDPEGAYVRHWLPELKHLDSKYIHAPWQAPQAALDAARITLGKTYPEPIVDHHVARDRALTALETIKKK
jgi:deoxyribodipyrimidine photo-lyase